MSKLLLDLIWVYVLNAGDMNMRSKDHFSIIPVIIVGTFLLQATNIFTLTQKKKSQTKYDWTINNARKLINHHRTENPEFENYASHGNTSVSKS